jgi:hypothetical protein
MHAYDQAGRPVYQVPNTSKGGMRTTTISDCRKLGLVPSVTEIIGQLDKPALLQWKVGKILASAFEHQLDCHKGFDTWCRLVQGEVTQEAKKAPELGSAIHDALESFYDEESAYNGKYFDHVQKVTYCVQNDVGDYKYIAEASFAHPLGFGGKVDLHAKQNVGIVLDFKTKDTTDTAKMKGYKEHIMQLAAYREGLGIPNARCFNLFISTKDPSILMLQEYSEKDLGDAWAMFKCLLAYWQIANKMPVRL